MAIDIFNTHMALLENMASIRMLTGNDVRIGTTSPFKLISRDVLPARLQQMNISPGVSEYIRSNINRNNIDITPSPMDSFSSDGNAAGTTNQITNTPKQTKNSLMNVLNKIVIETKKRKIQDAGFRSKIGVNWQPLAPSTIKSKGSSDPLIKTGKMMNSIRSNSKIDAYGDLSVKADYGVNYGYYQEDGTKSRKGNKGIPARKVLETTPAEEEYIKKEFVKQVTGQAPTYPLKDINLKDVINQAVKPDRDFDNVVSTILTRLGM